MTTEETVKLIHSIVTEFRDKKADADIQKLYASDNNIQKLYTRR